VLDTRRALLLADSVGVVTTLLRAARRMSMPGSVQKFTAIPFPEIAHRVWLNSALRIHAGTSLTVGKFVQKLPTLVFR
jgi:hypothetical protein